MSRILPGTVCALLALLFGAVAELLGVQVSAVHYLLRWAHKRMVNMVQSSPSTEM